MESSGPEGGGRDARTRTRTSWASPALSAASPTPAPPGAVLRMHRGGDGLAEQVLGVDPDELARGRGGGQPLAVGRQPRQQPVPRRADQVVRGLDAAALDALAGLVFFELLGGLDDLVQ